MQRIISFNVNGIRAMMKKGFGETIAALNADVLCLQETKATAEQVQEALKDISGYHLFASSAERPGYSGTAVLSKVNPMNVTYGLGISEHDNEGRTITAEYKGCNLVNTYVPNSGQELVRLEYRQRWDKDLLVYLQKLSAKKPVLWLGDLNVAHRPIDLANPKSNYNKTSGYTQQEIDGMDAVHKAGFIDSFRHFYPDTIKYSWWSARFNSRAKNVGWRIDYVICDPAAMKQVKDAFILNEIMGSDHCPVGVELNAGLI
ncbi:MAG: exodeoxyribonuclease III [Flavobacteriales bacterium]|nr:exodeoxyribonuclease III [Flavobacteriales bacterium]